MLSNRSRRYRARTGKKLHPAAIVGICLGATVLVVLLIGNLLNLWLDDETYRKLTVGDPPAEEIPTLHKANVRQVNAYPFALGVDIEGVLGAPALSVSLNTETGTLLYSSDVAAALGLSQKNEVDLQDSMSELCAFVPHVSGVWRSQAFHAETEDLFYAATVEEAALLREFLRAGGSEIVLYDLPLSADNLDRLITYLTALKVASPKTAVGVAVPLSVASSSDGWEIISTLLTVCEFCALDLTAEDVTDPEPIEGDLSPAAQDLLKRASYYLTAYDMRLFLAEEQTALLNVIEIQMYPNYQVLSKDETP